MNEITLRRNVRLYGWFKVFNKRVFLPMTAIYLVEVGHVSLGGIGIIATVTGLVTLCAQIPTAYVADRRTRRFAMMIGSIILALGVAVLIPWPSLAGGLLAGVLSGLGFAFISGSGQALIHDSLEQCGKGNTYVKIMGRAQSKGLIGNIVLIGLVPMTYAIDKRLPFILGVVAFLILFVISWAFVEPASRNKPNGTRHISQIFVALRTFVNRRTVVLFAAVGLVFGLYSAPTDYTNLILKDLGLAPQFIGLAFAASSFAGAIGGYGLHHLQRLSFKRFVILDVLVCCSFFVIVGITRSLPITAVAFVINLSFWRLRSILYQHYLFEVFKDTTHKAMLVSVLGFVEQLFVIVLPTVFVLCILHWGYYVGYTVVGIVGCLLLIAISMLGFEILSKQSTNRTELNITI